MHIAPRRLMSAVSSSCTPIARRFQRSLYSSAARCGRLLENWVNRERGQRTAVARAAYALWRLNWIHPFAGGNGRMSRAVAYLIVCMEAGAMLPGTPPLPELIYETRDQNVAALRKADMEEAAGKEPAFAAMSAYLRDHLTRQLASALGQLTKYPSPV
jgi:Fic family protein